ncbi:MAG TPA: T9SS type A sorting domain-containing protein, partial [Puia sp.]|nr:T9SS type A sorting domain-containing protein [Puia sp.]
NWTIDVAVGVTSITVSSGYTGAIIQGAHTITVSGAASFGGGTFTGGSANMTITGVFTNSATAFTSTSAIMELQSDAAFTGGSFAHNNGEVRFNGAAAQTISGTSPVFYTLEFVGTGHTYTLSSGGNIGVLNNLSITGASSCNLNTGTLAVSGNISLTNTSAGDGGTGTILITGAANQAIVSALPVNESTLPSVNINKTGGTLTFPSMLTVMGNWTYTAGTLDVTTNNSTVVFNNTLTITGSHTLNTISFEGSNNWTFTLAAGTTLTANGDMNLTGTGNLIFATGTINLNGNLNLTNTATGGGGTAVIDFTGSTNQSITSTLPVNQSSLPGITINKSGGTLLFPALVTARSNWVYTAGTIDVTTNNTTIIFASPLGTGAFGITGSLTLNNVTFEGNNNNTVTVNTGTIVTVTGTLATTGGFNVFINTPVAGATAIQAQGNISIGNTSVSGGGTGLILINGTGAQQFSSSSPASSGLLPNITIQKTSGTLSLSGILSVTRNWTYTSGTVDAITGASTVVFGGNNLNITSAGMSFYNVTTTANTSTLTNALTVSNNLSINGLSVLAPGANTVNIGGNWSAWGSTGFNSATSVVNFNGAALQTVTSAGGATFSNLIINNSSTGVQLANNALVTAALTMTQGNIDLNGNTLTLGTTAAAPGTLNYTAGTMINTGSFTRWFKAAAIAAGSVSGLFPVGNSNNYQPLYISTTVAPTTGGTVSLSYAYVSGNTLVSFLDGASTVAVIKNLNWALSTGNGLAGGTYSLDAQGTGMGIIGTVADLRLTLAGSVVGVAGVNAGTTADPQVNRTGLTLANLSNTFHLGSVNAVSSPLPVTLVSFTAAVVNGQVKLDWETAMETNNDYFTVQRSKDGTRWDSLERVAGTGNGNGASFYSAYDAAPYAGVSFYRLVQTDLDGNEAYSSICAVKLQSLSANITIFPNPATNVVLIHFPVAGQYTVALLNGAGRSVTERVFSSGNTLILNVSRVSPGMYYVVIEQGNRRETRAVAIGK